MAKFNLDVSDIDEADYCLIGISSHSKIYKLCWSLNQRLGLHFQKADFDIESSMNRKKNKIQFEVYIYNDEITRYFYHLISNRKDEHYLLPEFKQVDYLMLIKENLAVNFEQMIDGLKSSELILTAFEIKYKDVLSKENLLF